MKSKSKSKIFSELKFNKENILRIASTYGAFNIRVFGSVPRGEATSESDIDFLVDFEQGRSLFDLINVKLELEDLLGRKVDVVTEKSLHALIRDAVLSEAVKL